MAGNIGVLWWVITHRWRTLIAFCYAVRASALVSPEAEQSLRENLTTFNLRQIKWLQLRKEES